MTSFHATTISFSEFNTSETRSTLLFTMFGGYLTCMDIMWIPVDNGGSIPDIFVLEKEASYIILLSSYT